MFSFLVTVIIYSYFLNQLKVGLLYTAARLAHNTSIVFVPLYLQETQQSAEVL